MNLVDYDKRYATAPSPESDVLACRDFIVRYTSLAGGSGSLLDVGCGLGAWSMALAEWYKVVGVDNCRIAIDRARKAFPDIQFICDDVLEMPHILFDIVFCKAPELFSINPVESAEFQNALYHLISLTRKKFILILYVQPPFDRYVSTDPKKERTSYINDPRKIHALLNKFGKADTQVYGNRMVSELTVG